MNNNNNNYLEEQQKLDASTTIATASNCNTIKRMNAKSYFRLNDLKLRKNNFNNQIVCANEQHMTTKCLKCTSSSSVSLNENKSSNCNKCQIKLRQAEDEEEEDVEKEEEGKTKMTTTTEHNNLKLLNLKTINNKFNLKLKLNYFNHNNFKYYFIE